MIARKLFVALLAGLVATAATLAQDNPEIVKRRRAERTTFSDAEITKGFFLTAFGAELRFAGNSDRIRKYHVPIRIFVDNRATKDRSALVGQIVADIKSRVAGLDLELTTEKSAANVEVLLLNGRDFAPALRAAFGRDRLRRIQRSLGPQCLSGFRKDAQFRIQHSNVYLVADTSDFTFLDCAYEELLQSLGPINDTDKVPWTMFNDRVRLGFFGVYDQYLLNILYHPRISAGMTRTEVKALLPGIMPEVRAFVAKRNNAR